MDLGGITAGSRIFWDTLVVEKIIENCAQNHTFPPVLLHKSGFFPSPPETCQVGAPMSWLHGGTQITWGGSVPCEEEPICHMEIGVSDLHGPAQPQPQSNLSEVCPSIPPPFPWPLHQVLAHRDICFPTGTAVFHTIPTPLGSGQKNPQAPRPYPIALQPFMQCLCASRHPPRKGLCWV